jgi:starch-binding outer membrane protein, SusD/RagB family
MKKYIIVTTFLLAALTSCEDTLDYEVKDRITLENFFQTEDDAVNSVNAVYDALGAVDLYRSSLWLIQDIGSDDCDALSTWNDPNAMQIDRYELQTDNNYLANIWKASYQLIARANLSIDRIPAIDMDDNLKNRLLGEVRFLRAVSYFNLVRMYGDVPLVLTPESNIDAYLVPRDPSEDVYAQIISDLDSAAEVLPVTYSGLNLGRATRGAALGILAKVYLTREEWSLAAQKAKDVIDLADQGVYGLWPNFADNFKEANENGQESVFEVQFYSAVQEENTRIVISGLPSIFAFPAGVGIILPTDDLLNSFEAGDHRYESTFFSEYTLFGTQTFDPHIWKHWDQNTYSADKTGQSGANFPIMRYAEVLLMYAEALNEQNQGPTPDAYNAVNAIRIRARNGNDTVLPELSGLSYEEFRAAVWKEKRMETVNEGHRWFDLVRTGRLVERVKAAKGQRANPQPHNTVFPIPQRERDLNDKLTQNDLY